ncbi:MAG: MATE family efflux transporter [Myxococcales bacterium]|nr:MAG: MATE family efflux transporter [Myxococcales bacterium]
MKTQKTTQASRLSESVYAQDPGPAQFRFLFLEPKILGRIIHLGWPVIVGMLTQTAVNTIDLLMVGRLSDAEAVPGTAAIMASIVLLWAYGGFLSSISVGTQALSARRYSEGNFEKAGQVLTNSVAVSVVASIVITTVAILLIEPTMTLLTKSQEVQLVGSEYSQIRLLGLPSMALMASFKSFYDGLGRVRIHMTVAIIMNIVNIICNYFLIFGSEFAGFKSPYLGVNGAAWGSVIASYTGLLVMIFWALRKKDRERFKIFRFKNLNSTIALAVSRLSLWSGLATVVLMVGVGLFNFIVSAIDVAEGSSSINASAASIILHVMMLVFMTCLAFGTSTATLVSQSIGAKLPKLAERYVWQCVLLAVYVMSIFGFITFLLPKPILALFLPPDLDASHLKELVINTATPSLKMCALLLSPTAAAALVLTQALYGAGETRYIMIAEFCLHFLCLVPLAWLLALHFGLGILGCWIAAIIYAAGLLIACASKFLSGSWKKLVL